MKSNLQLQGLLKELKKQSIEQNVNIWKRVATDLEKPTRNKRIVNLSRLERFTKENEIVIIPGKLLGTGELNHKLTIAAHKVSRQAIDKIRKSDSKIYSIYDFMQKNPKGSKTRIIG